MENLKKIIICPHCNSLNIKKELKNNEIAICRKCGYTLYKKIPHLEIKIFSLVISGIIFFIIAMFFPVVDIDIIGYKENLKVFEASIFLFNKGYIFISLFVFFTVFLFPFICACFYFLITFLFIFKYNKPLIKRLLILITVMKDWCFLDIFFIAILVALIKIFSYADVIFDIGFVGYIIFLSIMFYIVKFLGVESLWEIYENI